MAQVRSSAAASRGAWTLLDQAASSATNFALSLVMLRELTLAQFGLFSLVYLTYQTLLRPSRALFGQPLAVIRATPEDREPVARAVSAGTVSVALVALVVAFAAMGLPAEVRGGFLALAVTLPGLLGQDIVRFMLLLDQRPKAALLNDVLWGALQLVPLILLASRGRLSLTTGIGIWGASAFVAWGVGLWQLRVVPKVSGWRQWFAQTRSIGPALAVETTIGNGVHQIALVMFAATVSVSALGAVNAVRVLLGPVNVLYIGIFAAGVSEGPAILRSSRHGFDRLRLLAAIVLVLAAAAAFLVLQLVPDDALEFVTNLRVEVMQPYMLPVAITVASQGWMIADRVAYTVLDAANRGVRAQLLAAPLVIVGLVVGGFVGGGVAAAYGLAIGSAFSAVAFNRGLRRVPTTQPTALDSSR